MAKSGDFELADSFGPFRGISNFLVESATFLLALAIF